MSAQRPPLRPTANPSGSDGGSDVSQTLCGLRFGGNECGRPTGHSGTCYDELTCVAFEDGWWADDRGNGSGEIGGRVCSCPADTTTGRRGLDWSCPEHGSTPPQEPATSGRVSSPNEADADDVSRFGFRWGNVRVTRLLQATRGKTTHRVLSVSSQRHSLDIYVTEGRGDIRVYRDGEELT